MRNYLDLALLLNTLVDGLLLLGTNRLAGCRPRWSRCLLAALVGGLYARVSLTPGFFFLGNTLWRLVFLGIMGGIAFGLDKSGWKRSGLFALLSMAMGGMATGLGKASLPVYLLCAAGIWLLCRIGLAGVGEGKEYVPLEIRYGDRQVRLTALRDTGNSLRDPITGERVLVIGADAAGKLTDLTAAQLRNPLETMGKRVLPGLRLIPYRAVGQPAGLMLCMRLKDVKLGNRCGAALVAFAPDCIGRDEGFQALTGGGL